MNNTISDNKQKINGERKNINILKKYCLVNIIDSALITIIRLVFSTDVYNRPKLISVHVNRFYNQKIEIVWQASKVGNLLRRIYEAENVESPTLPSVPSRFRFDSGKREKDIFSCFNIKTRCILPSLLLFT